jgi:ADP-ribose pyrophosphatase YjhB (NUDIX family)
MYLLLILCCTYYRIIMTLTASKTLNAYLKTDDQANKFVTYLMNVSEIQKYTKPCRAAFVLILRISGGVLRLFTTIEKRPGHPVFGVPGGLIEKSIRAEMIDTSGVNTGIRELYEETGVEMRKFRDTQFIATVSFAPGIRHSVYFCNDPLPNGVLDAKYQNNEVSGVCSMRFENIFTKDLKNSSHTYFCNGQKLRLRNCHREMLLGVWNTLNPE